MKALLAVLWSAALLGAAAWGVHRLIFKPSPAQRADKFLASLAKVALDDREIVLDRFIEEDPEAAKFLMTSPGGPGVRFRA